MPKKIPPINWNLTQFLLPDGALVKYDDGTIFVIKRTPSNYEVPHERNAIVAYKTSSVASNKNILDPQNIVPFDGRNVEAIQIELANSEEMWFPVTSCTPIDICPVVQSDSGCAPTACLWRDYLYTVGPPYPSGADPINT